MKTNDLENKNKVFTKELLSLAAKLKEEMDLFTESKMVENLEKYKEVNEILISLLTKLDYDIIFEFSYDEIDKIILILEQYVKTLKALADNITGPLKKYAFIIIKDLKMIRILNIIKQVVNLREPSIKNLEEFTTKSEHLEYYFSKKSKYYVNDIRILEAVMISLINSEEK